MARKKQDPRPAKQETNPNAHILGAGTVVEQKITETLEVNYMPYAMSVILSRAIPEIDGFKPSHRKLLYTMYKMGLLTGGRTKSANIVGTTMRLNPHGDAAIYDTMVRLSVGYEALLHPYVDSKGNFGKAYSRDMQWAASRYTEAKLAAISQELFSDIDKNTVDFVDNYDATMKEPTLLPVTFPSILVNANTGIAVGMASSICSFNLAEVCNTAIALMRNPDHDVMDTLKAPDFTVGATVLYDRDAIRSVYETGRGSIRVRGKYAYDKANNCIDITQIPPTTTVEAIIDKIIEKVKANVIREINDVRDETDKSGLKITIDLKRGANPEKLMQKIYKMTPLEDSFACNFNVLVNGVPRVLGVKALLDEWTSFRMGCVRRRTQFDLDKASSRLHLLKGLSKILLDIDKAIKIIRETDEESEVVPNLMIGFGIDETQAEYVAEIKLRHLNREYILKRTADMESLKQQIAELKGILGDDDKIREIIIAELEEIVRKYGQPRKTDICYDLSGIDSAEEEEEVPDYQVDLTFTRDGYLKKVPELNARRSSENKLKEGDAVVYREVVSNATQLLFFTDRQQVYKARLSDFADTKMSNLGEYIPSALGFDPEEKVFTMIPLQKYEGYIIFVFANGKLAKILASSYETKTNRKKLMNAYSGASPLVSCLYIPEDCDLLISSTSGKYLILNTALVLPKSTRDTIGVNVMTQKRSCVVNEAKVFTPGELSMDYKYRARKLPSAGVMLADGDNANQLHL
ncbi:MAG TPA: topoisomerase IV [Candidatus Onthovicinus excrementipullorum]|nr:topoisomerase IV [Candidatus Onthovicinus excrementipullorum]